VSIPPFLRPPTGVTPHAVTTDRGTFAVLDNRSALDEPRGSAVLVPGFTGSKEDFIAVLAPLAARGVHALALDLAGQYESTRPDDTVYSLGGFAADVWSVAHQLAGPRVLVGHSFGGLVVREALLSDPLSAQGLVIVASGPAALPDDQQRVLRMFAQVLQHQGLAAVWQAKQALEKEAAGVTPAPAEIDAFLTARFVAHAPASLLAMIEVLTDGEDQVDALATVAPPSVVVVGGKDDAWPVAEQRAMAERLGARLVELPEAGHSPAVDDPEATADAIASLLP
jgi:pimeloyl-ACP methyl ester carboxylesterase